MKKHIFILLFPIISSCCKLPLINCGPNFVNLNTEWTIMNASKHPQVSFEFSSQYYKGRSEKSNMIKLECKISDNSKVYKVLLDKANVSMNNCLSEEDRQIILLQEYQEVDNSDVQIFVAQLTGCKYSKLPYTINLDSIPIKNMKTISYINARVIVSQ